MKPSDRVRAADLGITGLLWVFAVLSLLLLAALAIAPVRDHFTEWRAAQERYNDAARAVGAPTVEVAIKQIWRPELDRVDRCGSCHLGMVDATPDPHEPLFAAHPAIHHDVRDLGCTVCHGGQGRATSADAAHGEVEFWDEPMLPRAYLEAGCGVCHSGIAVAGDVAALGKRFGAPRLVAGKALSLQLGCRGCHKIGGVGGEEGPDLANIGGRVARDLDFSGVSGERTLPTWLKAHFLDPARVVPQSLMPDLGMSAEQAELLTVYMLSLRTTHLPAERTPRDRVRTAQLGERDFASDGASLFAAFCVGCHGAGGAGRRLGAGPDATFPAIGSPAFLAIADDELLRATVTRGRSGRKMPAWGTKEGGLTAAEIDELVRHLRSLEAQPPAFGAVMAARADLAAGERLYDADCRACHGARGEGSALGPPANPGTGEQALYRLLVARSPGMGSYATYTAPELRAVIAFVRTLPPRTAGRFTPAAGDPRRGQPLFAATCAGCHGERGQGKLGPALASPELLAAASDGYLATTILRGRGGTAMPRFGRPGTGYRALAAGEVADLVAYVRTLAPRPATPRPR
jgi:mono/diheme cytochrome c family protein/Na+-transporting methylmalonyl-CoA/oxaloacetate decarboxylase gamma subunit